MNRVRTAILSALLSKATKTAALRDAWRSLNDSGHYIGQHELAMQWNVLVGSGAIIRDGRRWQVASWARP